MSGIPIVGQFGALERLADVVATFVEQHPQVSNLELHDLSKLLLGALIQQNNPDIASAMILTALLAVRDAPHALRGDTRTISESKPSALTAH